nr:bifunctional hydroxymethylpyrimidine kinase/phosphomethylpyrimidine kinase [Salisediminibacterium haloalkalitolerans]
MMKKALTIAGSDSGGGAGIQADIKTFQELSVFGMSAITALTAQNSLGVQGVYPVSVEGVEQQIRSVSDDLAPDAVKTGMLFDKEIIDVVADLADHYHWPELVVDPVMVSTSGAKLLKDDAIEHLMTRIVPLATVITPNIPEAEVMTGMDLNGLANRKKAAQELAAHGAKTILLKGGHEDGADTVTDLFYDGKSFHALSVPKINTKSTHGTGCTYASAITAYLARGETLLDAVILAKKYIHTAIKHGFRIGQGPGPVDHTAHRNNPFNELEVTSS